MEDLERVKQAYLSLPNLSPSHIWSNIFGNVQETIHAQHWTQEDLSCNPQETLILSNLEAQLTKYSPRNYPSSHFPFPQAPLLGIAPL
jgi:hypothetical protein